MSGREVLPRTAARLESEIQATLRDMSDTELRTTARIAADDGWPDLERKVRREQWRRQRDAAAQRRRQSR